MAFLFFLGPGVLDSKMEELPLLPFSYFLGFSLLWFLDLHILVSPLLLVCFLVPMILHHVYLLRLSLFLFLSKIFYHHRPCFQDITAVRCEYMCLSTVPNARR